MIGLSEKVTSVPEKDCPRCGGLMVWSYSNEFEAEVGQHLCLLRCINCGELIEKQIVVNRGAGPPTDRLKPSRLRFRRQPLRG